MRQHSPDRELRRLIVDLAALHPDDLDAILNELDQGQRGTVERLLREFAGFGFRDLASATDPQPCHDRSRLSAWMIHRLDSETPEITPHARAVLRASASHTASTPTHSPAPGRGKTSGGKSVTVAVGKRAA